MSENGVQVIWTEGQAQTHNQPKGERKRGKDRNLSFHRGTYWINAQRHGHRLYHSLHTTNREEAVKLLRAELDAFETAWRADRLQEFWLLASPRKAEKVAEAAECPSLGAVIDAWRGIARARGLKERTSYLYVWSVLAVAGLTEVEAGKVRVDVALSGDAVRRFEERMMGERGDDSGRRSIVSILRQARAMFGRGTLHEYGGLKTEHVEGLMRPGRVRAPAVKFMAPLTHGELCRRTPELIRGLEKENPRLWLACCLMYGCALRNSEAAAARWGWMCKDVSGSTEQMGVYVCERRAEGFVPKAKGSTRWVPLAAGMLEGMRAAWMAIAGREPAAEDFVLPADSVTGRRELLGRELCLWMRGIGWAEAEFDKAAYLLRALRGSEWYTAAEIGPAQCSQWLGHVSLETTCRHYACLTRQAVQRPM